jgi:hypothetical protein
VCENLSFFLTFISPKGGPTFIIFSTKHNKSYLQITTVHYRQLDFPVETFWQPCKNSSRKKIYRIKDWKNAGDGFS